MELRKKIDKILARLLIIIMSIMVINVLWQVLAGIFWEPPVPLPMNWRDT